MINITLAAANAAPNFKLYGEDHHCATLDQDEIEFFNAQFNELLGTSDSVLRKILEARVSLVLNGVRAIKYKLNGAFFRGFNPSDSELGWGFIRPEFVKGDNDGGAWDAELTDWNQTLTGMGTWDAWLGATATTPFLLSEEHGLILTHLTSQVSPAPFVRGVRFWVGREQLIPYEVSDILLGDNEHGIPHFPIPSMIVLPEGQLRASMTGVAGTEYLKLGGFVVGLGRRLKEATPSW